MHEALTLSCCYDGHHLAHLDGVICGYLDPIHVSGTIVRSRHRAGLDFEYGRDMRPHMPTPGTALSWSCTWSVMRVHEEHCMAWHTCAVGEQGALDTPLASQPPVLAHR